MKGPVRACEKDPCRGVLTDGRARGVSSDESVDLPVAHA